MATQLFGTVISVSLPASSGMVLTGVALGGISLVNCTLVDAAQVIITGITATGGNIDGMVAVVSNVSNNTSKITFSHEDTSAPATSRLRNAGLTSPAGSTGAGASWYRYNGTTQRWVQLARI